jgi:nickel-dependent lactate racemase
VRIELPYGNKPYVAELPDDRDVQVLAPPVLLPPPPVADLLAVALDVNVPRARRITVVVSDATRMEPRAAFLDALRQRFADVRWTIAIATGTHGPARLDELGLPAWARSVEVVNHDGHDARGLVELGATSRGTPIRVHRCVVETDLVVATGCIRPHYFAGFGAGVKAIFPGLGEVEAIRINHRLKTSPGAYVGSIVGNPCRDDLEEATATIPVTKLLVNGVCDGYENVRAVVVGDVVEAFRRGVALTRAWFNVPHVRAPIVIASERLPVSGSLYQAAKIAAACAPFVTSNGRIIIVAECAGGGEPVEVVNEAVWRMGVYARLPHDVDVQLVSELDDVAVRRTLLVRAESVDHAVRERPGSVVVLPYATHVIAND